MPVTNKNNNPVKQAKVSKLPAKTATITKEVGNYEKHPFFVKKANDMKEFLEKVGLPKRLAKAK